MRQPTHSEERMMAAILMSLSEEAVRSGEGSGCFHGFEVRVVRLGQRNRREPSRVRIKVNQDGVLVDELTVLVQ